MKAWADRTLSQAGNQPKTKLPYPDVKSVAFTGAKKAWIDKDPKKHPRPDNPPSWVHDEGTWEKAKAAVQKYWGNYSEPWAVVTHVYEQMGGG